jgi:uncharacterized protein (DUF488 family)
LFTLGYTHKSAEEIFSLMAMNKIENLIDVRLNNVSQLAGFTKKNDFQFFLKKISDINYYHFPYLAPTKEILNAYKKKEISWDEYERKFNTLMKERRIETKININIFHNGCLLCSEESADKCHRRLVAEYLKNYFNEIVIKHI